MLEISSSDVLLWDRVCCLCLLAQSKVREDAVMWLRASESVGVYITEYNINVWTGVAVGMGWSTGCN
jgi:hypothetical protein